MSPSRISIDITVRCCLVLELSIQQQQGQQLCNRVSDAFHLMFGVFCSIDAILHGKSWVDHELRNFRWSCVSSPSIHLIISLVVEEKMSGYIYIYLG